MFLPIGDSPNPRATPWLTYALIAVNVVVFLATWPMAFRPPDPADPALAEYAAAIVAARELPPEQAGELVRGLSAYDVFVYRHGLLPGRFSLADLFTSMFLHGGIAHLLGNMLFLWIYGDNVEHRAGRLGFLAAYLGTGVAAALGDMVLRWGSLLPAVGASGAISGVLGLYFVWFPRNRVRIWVFLFPLFADVVELPARLVLTFYVLLDNVLPLLLGSRGGVAHGAHLGGFFAGLALAYATESVRTARARNLGRRGPGESVTPARLEHAFADALRRDDVARALSLLFDQPRHLTRSGLTAGEKIDLAEALERDGHARAALAVYQRALSDHPRGPGLPRAHLGAARVLMGRLGLPTAAYQHLYSALEEEPSEAERLQARELLRQLEQATRSIPRHTP
ncbi:MAG: rhomboid family intramembrane serine protease [Acidobacteria bacterium]|nr:rhomboid family intramembrane serine protease [Acidobacteriota bacterium]